MFSFVEKDDIKTNHILPLYSQQNRMILSSCAVLCRTGQCVGGETEEVPPNHNTDQIWGNYQPSSHHKHGLGTDADHTLVTPHTHLDIKMIQIQR